MLCSSSCISSTGSSLWLSTLCHVCVTCNLKKTTYANYNNNNHRKIMNDNYLTDWLKPMRKSPENKTKKHWPVWHQTLQHSSRNWRALTHWSNSSNGKIFFKIQMKAWRSKKGTHFHEAHEASSISCKWFQGSSFIKPHSSVWSQSGRVKLWQQGGEGDT